MQQHLVVWGDIGTDRKALITIELKEEIGKVIYHAFPQEMVTKTLQDELFSVWKNGGECTFPEDTLKWVIDSHEENWLPEGMTLHKPGILINAQRQWQKMVMRKSNFLLFTEKVDLLKIELDSLKSFDEQLWNNAKTTWDDILKSKKENLLSWQDADALKVDINKIFDGLKAFKRINTEHNFEESRSLLKLYEKQIKECREALVYPKEWNNIFDRLKNIQSEVKKDHLIFKHKKILFNQLDIVFKDLRNYRQVDQVHHLEDRIKGLHTVIQGLQHGIDQDIESYEHQVQKMKHYTRGKMTDEEIEEQFKHLKEKAHGRQKKIKSIKKTIGQLEKKLEATKTTPTESTAKKKKPKSNKPRTKQKPEQTTNTLTEATKLDSQANDVLPSKDNEE
ncbi:MAG: hypothetical protein R2730_09275 [Chitinophagales bacterium]